MKTLAGYLPEKNYPEFSLPIPNMNGNIFPSLIEQNTLLISLVNTVSKVELSFIPTYTILIPALNTLSSTSFDPQARYD